MDDLLFYVLLNSILVISGSLESANEMLWANGNQFMFEVFLPSAGIKPRAQLFKTNNVVS